MTGHAVDHCLISLERRVGVLTAVTVEDTGNSKPHLKEANAGEPRLSRVMAKSGILATGSVKDLCRHQLLDLFPYAMDHLGPHQQHSNEEHRLHHGVKADQKERFALPANSRKGLRLWRDNLPPPKRIINGAPE